MQISQQVLTTHQFTSPNTGECVAIDELPRVLGILSFLTENRMVEVSPK